MNFSQALEISKSYQLNFKGSELTETQQRILKEFKFDAKPFVRKFYLLQNETFENFLLQLDTLENSLLKYWFYLIKPRFYSLSVGDMSRVYDYFVDPVNFFTPKTNDIFSSKSFLNDTSLEKCIKTCVAWDYECKTLRKFVFSHPEIKESKYWDFDIFPKTVKSNISFDDLAEIIFRCNERNVYKYSVYPEFLELQKQGYEISDMRSITRQRYGFED